ncbi:TonB-dependent receptor [Bacteroides sp.]|uniref:SusC/RagA family TonB-linked outer membrane protein n=1 Tax=Bacteroides sp. TaxID=29523 RepID=UPI002630DC4B|nr:TonB-dependent receptor [Bacteroides sp.]
MKHAEKAMHRLYSVGRSLFAILILLFCSLQVFAQGLVVKGVVKDATGEPVIGANVLEKGTTNGIITDIDGAYTLNNVNPKGTLIISFIGYTPVEVAVNGRKVIDVTMKEDAELLDEVVVVGYGAQKKASVTGSVAAMKGDDLKLSGVTNVSNMLNGRLPGVIASNRSGEPGADWSDILIRGKGTLNSTAPLIVIDGVANRSGMERMNPNDIESVSVLKDASAAIYGAQAANGVILITTKKGTSGKPTISYDGSYSMSQNTRNPNLMNAYQYMTYADERRNHLSRPDGSVLDVENEIAGDNNLKNYGDFVNIKKGYLDGTIDRNMYGDTDWIDAVFRPFAPQTRHSLSVKGGNEAVKYYISGDYSYQEPGYKNTVYNFQTAQMRANIEAQISKNFSIGLEASGRNEQRNNSPYSTGTMFWELMMAYPYLYDYYPNGLPGPGLQGGNNLAILASGKDIGYNRINDFFVDSKVNFEWKLPWITQGLSLAGYAAFDMRFNNNKGFWDVWDTYNYDPENKEYIKHTSNMDTGFINLNQSSDKNSSTTLHFRINYDRTFGDHHVGAFVAYEQNKFEGEGFWAWRNYFMSNKLDYLDFGGEQDKTNGGNGYVSARQNLFGRFNYSYKDRYLFEFTIRRDGSMNFASNKRWGTFPGLSIGWRIGEESFIKDNLPFVNDLKLRASWGKLGNDLSTAKNWRDYQFQYLSTYNMGDGAILGNNPQLGKGFTPGRIGNPDITWEKVDTKNIGLEGTLWNGLLGFSGEYFYQIRKDILTPKQASIPSYTGLSLPNQNIGEVSNQGFELALTHRNKIGSVNYNIGFNMTYTKNKIIFFDEAANVPEWQRRTGHQIDSWLMFKTDGIYKNWDEIENSVHFPGAKPGDIKYVNVDGDDVMSDNDRVRDYTSNVPEIVYGINFGLDWKGIEFSMLWTGQGKATQMIVPYSFNQDVDFYNNRFISEELTPNAKYPAAFNKDDPMNIRWSDFWLYNASFIRLKNVQVAYTLPTKWTSKLGIQNVRVYVAGDNLFTIDHIKLQDPESSASSANQYYPQQRTYTFGLNLSF